MISKHVDIDAEVSPAAIIATCPRRMSGRLSRRPEPRGERQRALIDPFLMAVVTVIALIQTLPIMLMFLLDRPGPAGLGGVRRRGRRGPHELDHRRHPLLRRESQRRRRRVAETRR